jgi:hypothetical protein
LKVKFERLKNLIEVVLNESHRVIFQKKDKNGKKDNDQPLIYPRVVLSWFLNKNTRQN